MTDTPPTPAPRTAAELTPAEVASVVELARRVKAGDFHAARLERHRDGSLCAITEARKVSLGDLENPHP